MSANTEDLDALQLVSRAAILCGGRQLIDLGVPGVVITELALLCQGEKALPPERMGRPAKSMVAALKHSLTIGAISAQYLLRGVAGSRSLTQDSFLWTRMKPALFKTVHLRWAARWGW
ncbi:hypothetical protein AYJ54_37340 [Bradyrhizobium centrolobii]|uniref:Uncharacterized protein n=1 Tax=Bradyrhizobium centrolobii TaxID=1505087 RepID=A0A176Z9F2_9BRAD|nr:hypothetical protein AYJ54_37340 [Bradyrhizobium centrolobii]